MRRKATFLIGIAVSVMVYSVHIASQRDLTSLENALLQFFSLAFGLAGSYVLGQHSLSEGVREAITPHARSAFRRLLSLYQSLSRVATIIEESQYSSKNLDTTIEVLKAIAIEQLATADDALEDWSDIVPDEVEELKQKMNQSLKIRG